MKARGQPEPPGVAVDAPGTLDRVLDQRPTLVALAGPNGAGKSTFYHAHQSALTSSARRSASSSVR